MNRRRQIFLLLAVFTLSALCVSAREGIFPPGEFVFLWEDEKAYLIANEAPLNEILEEISVVVGIPVATASESDKRITADLRDKTLEQIVNSIAPSSVMTFAAGGEEGEYVVESIRTTGVADPVAISANARRRVIEENRLDERLGSRFRRPVKFVGIGANISVTKDRKGLWLKPINEESPAYQGGIRMGDMALEIDGKRIDQFRHLGEAIRAIRGERNTPVKFLIRNPDGTEIYKTVVRDLFEYDPRRKENQKR